MTVKQILVPVIKQELKKYRDIGMIMTKRS